MQSVSGCSSRHALPAVQTLDMLRRMRKECEQVPTLQGTYNWNDKDLCWRFENRILNRSSPVNSLLAALNCKFYTNSNELSYAGLGNFLHQFVFFSLNVYSPYLAYTMPYFKAALHDSYYIILAPSNRNYMIY